MPFYSYEYFCGANVVIEIEGFPVLETAGLQVNARENKRPIYGYSSRHFDAVARGQVLVEGSLIINYVHQDYLFRAIEQGLIDQGLIIGEDLEFNPSKELEDQISSVEQADRLGSALLENYSENIALVQAFKDRLWSNPDVNQGSFNSLLPNPHDSFGGLDIRVTFGRRNSSNGYLGDTGLIITDVYFTGRGLPIQIDENVIIEEYPFFARNIYSLQQPYAIIEQPEVAETGDLTGDTVTFVTPIGG